MFNGFDRIVIQNQQLELFDWVEDAISYALDPVERQMNWFEVWSVIKHSRLQVIYLIVDGLERDQTAQPVEKMFAQFFDTVPAQVQLNEFFQLNERSFVHWGDPVSH